MSRKPRARVTSAYAEISGTLRSQYGPLAFDARGHSDRDVHVSGPAAQCGSLTVVTKHYNGITAPLPRPAAVAVQVTNLTTAS